MQRYRTKVTEVEASRLSVATAVDGVRGRVGDWLVLSNDQLSVMKAKDFVDRYELAGAAAEPQQPKREKKGGRPGPRPGARVADPDDTTAEPQREKKGGRRGPRVDANLIGQARALIERDGLSIQETATKLGLKYGRVWTWAKANGWDQK